MMRYFNRLHLPFQKKQVRLTQEIATATAFVFANWLTHQYLTDPLDYVNTYKHRVYENMVRQSSEAKAAILLKKLAVTANGWQITNEDTNEGGQQRQGDFVRDALMMLPNGLEPVLKRSLDALKFGFSLSEKVFSPIKDGEWAGLWGYKVIRDKPIYDFDIETADSGEITGFVQQQYGNSVHIPKWKMLYYGYQATSDNPYGISDLCPAFSHVFAQCAIDESWPAALKRYAMPFLKGKTGGSLNAKQRKEMTETLQKFKEEHGILLDDKLIDVELLEQGSSNQAYTAYERHQRYRSRQILLACLVPQLMVSEGDRVGSKALGAGQIRAFLVQVIKDIRQEHAYIVNKDVVEPLVDKNFQNVVDYPVFSYGAADAEDDTMWADIITSYIDKGVLSAETDAEWIREKHNFPTHSELKKMIDAPDDTEPAPMEEEEMDG